jgi:NADP-dependent 3-hydroxy acid dehydrogenase YdfG
MDRWIGRVAVVTGASAGIGAAVARMLVESGLDVVGCARRVDKIKAMAMTLNPVGPGKLFPYECDLGSGEEETRAMFQWIEANPRLGHVDICIANAGMSANETLLEGSFGSWKRMLDLNVLSLCLCTQLSAASMRAHGIDDGHIVFVNSMSGHRVPPNPATHFYAATKHAVTGLLEGWRQEMRDLGSNIRVSSLSPGFVETEFAPAMLAETPDGPKKAEELYRSLDCLQAEDMADSVKYILAAPKHVQIHDILVRPTAQKF